MAPKKKCKILEAFFAVIWMSSATVEASRGWSNLTPSFVFRMIGLNSKIINWLFCNLFNFVIAHMVAAALRCGSLPPFLFHICIVHCHAIWWLVSVYHFLVFLLWLYQSIVIPWSKKNEYRRRMKVCIPKRAETLI